MLRMIAVGAAAVLLAAPAARAAVTIRLDRTSGRPGDVVRATSSNCCFLSLYLVPARLVPEPYPCELRNGASAMCAPASTGSPRRRGWTWHGRFFPTRASFHFRVLLV